MKKPFVLRKPMMSFACAVAMVSMAMQADAAILHFNVVYGAAFPTTKESFNIDSSQIGVDSPAHRINGAGADVYENFVITNDSLGYQLLQLGSIRSIFSDGYYFATADTDNDAANSFRYPYTETSTSLYTGSNHQLVATAGETIVGVDGAVIIITAATTSVPEPSTIFLTLIGLAPLVARMRSRRRRDGMVVV